MEYRECARCEVAFDVGYKYCREPGCENVTVSIVRQEKKEKKRYYSHREKDPVLSRYTSIVSRSKKKGYECTVSYDLIAALINAPCVYCGSVFRIEVDRKYNNKGYTPDNVAPACHRCNTIKNNVVTYDEMMKIAEILGWRS